MEKNPYISMLYGAHKTLAIKKMMSVNTEWANLVNHHAFSDRFWGVPWQKDNYAMTDKEVITLSALISSGLSNQTALHIHGFLGSGGTLKELAALIHAAWRPKGSEVDPQFIERMSAELSSEPGIDQFIADLKNKNLPLSGLDVTSPLKGFTRLQLSELASAISAGKAEWSQMTNLMKQAQARGTTVQEIELILRHAEIYLGESAAIEGAQAWNEITDSNDGDLKKMYIENVHSYYADTQFYEWMPSAEEDPAFKPLFDMTLALASKRVEKIETNLEEYISLNRGIHDKDYNKIALASTFANGHTNPNEFQIELKRSIQRGLDDATFQRLANRATRIVGYPVAMNAYLAYAQAKLS